jgi:TIR domain
MGVSGESKAVFLSYASEDAEAAGRIAETLRAANIEVWFDREEPPKMEYSGARRA